MRQIQLENASGRSCLRTSMVRMLLVLLFASLATNNLSAEPIATGEFPQLTFEVDLIQIEREFLKEIANDELPSNGLLVLDEIEAFFVRRVVAQNIENRNVYGRGKTTFPDGKPITISNRPFNDAAKRMIVHKGAWLHERPFTFELSPKVLSANTLSLTLKYSMNGREESRGVSTVVAGKTVLVLLDSWKNGVCFATMITPRIIRLD